MRRTVLLYALGLIAALSAAAQTTPPYSGTIFLDPDIVLPSDPTVYDKATFTGRGQRTVFDRRVNNWVTIDAYLFELTFTDGTTIEAQVNPEFGSQEAALAQVEYFGPFIGQLPAVLRKDIDALWVHQGVEPFGGGNRSILIHTGQADAYVASGILEETLIHEAAHTSLDAEHASAPGWIAAQQADPTFISTYARDNPTREDIAESFLPYLAVRYRSDRISQALYDTIMSTIPNRVAYFDAQGFDMAPLAGSPVATEEAPGPYELALTITPHPVRSSARIQLTLDRPQTVRISVFDLLGRVVAEIEGGELPAGDVTRMWDASGLAAGLYLCRVVVGETVISRPVVVQP